MTLGTSPPRAADGSRAGRAPTVPEPAAIYRERRERFGRERDRLTARWNLVANLRLLAFVAAAACLGWGVWRRAPWLGPPAALLCGAFVALVVHHGRLGRARRRFDELWRINDEAGKRLARDWDALPVRHTARAAPDHPYAADLDLFGRASLAHLLETVATGPGEATLAAWLAAPAPVGMVRERQGAVAELAPLLDLRDELQVRGRLAGDARPDPEPFLTWAEGGRWLTRRPALLWGARLSPPLFWALLALWLAGLVPYPLWLPFLLTNFALAEILGRRARAILARVASQEGAFRHYAGSFAILAGASFAAPALARLQDELTAGGESAYASLRRLERAARFIMPPEAVAAPFLQRLFLWDAQVLAALEEWQAAAGGRARRWLAALGEVEALAALAGLAHDNPAWAFPDFDPAATALEARGLGHPLLPADGRVVNDVTVGPVGAFLLVTGSNMSGKSTLLRALGVNVALAGAGGPVCAGALRLPPVALWTSMRVQDSLARGVSYFMAELQRLKQIVDAARPGAADDDGDAGGRRVLYLLDEILQGTNTAERQIAARRIILFLVGRGALGVVSTHDLTLADEPGVAAVAHPVHFTETFATTADGPAMSFDYRLRPGIATSTNALRLMELVGLALDAGDRRPV